MGDFKFSDLLWVRAWDGVGWRVGAPKATHVNVVSLSAEGAIVELANRVQKHKPRESRSTNRMNGKKIRSMATTHTIKEYGKP